MAADPVLDQAHKFPIQLKAAARVPLTDLADWCAVGVVASLPWSTSATGILIVWMITGFTPLPGR